MFQEYVKTHPKQSVTIVRVVAVTGPRAGPSGLNVLFLPVTMYVRGCDPEWQFIYEDDLAKLDVYLVKERKSGVFNAGAEGSVRYREMLGFTGKPSLGLPAWLWKPLISVGWKLHIQRKSQVGGLEFMKYPILVSTEKLAKTTNFKFTMNSRDALKSFMDANMVGGQGRQGCQGRRALPSNLFKPLAPNLGGYRRTQRGFAPLHAPYHVGPRRTRLRLGSEQKVGGLAKGSPLPGWERTGEGETIAPGPPVTNTS